MGTDRLVEQSKNRLRKSYTFQNFTISAQRSAQIDFHRKPGSAYTLWQIGRFEKRKGQDTSPPLMIGFSCRIAPVYGMLRKPNRMANSVSGIGAIAAP